MSPNSRRGCINESNLVKKAWLTWKHNKSYDNVRDIKVKARWADENRQVPKAIWKEFFNAGENPAIYFPAYHSMGQKLRIKFGAQRPALSNNCTYCRDGQGGGGRRRLSKARNILWRRWFEVFSLKSRPVESHLSYFSGRCILKCLFPVFVIASCWSKVSTVSRQSRPLLRKQPGSLEVLPHGIVRPGFSEQLNTQSSENYLKLWKLPLKLSGCLPNTWTARGLAQQPSLSSAVGMQFG